MVTLNGNATADLINTGRSRARRNQTVRGVLSKNPQATIKELA